MQHIAGTQTAETASDTRTLSGRRIGWSRQAIIALGALLLMLALAASPPSLAQATADADGDGVADADDNCPLLANTDQADGNGNGLGDVCEDRLAVEWNLGLRSQGGQITILSVSDFTGGMGMPMASGDLNGDGLADLIFAPFNDHRVKGWISDERLGQEIRFNPDGSAPPGGFVIRGAGADSLGCEVDAADINGDGFDDLLMGEPEATASGLSQAGSVHVLFGGQPIPAEVDLGAPPPGLALARIDGVVAGGQLGCWISSADVDGDGVADILVGASDADSPDGTRQGSGTFYLILGGSERFAPGAVIPASAAEVTVHGRDAFDRFGSQATAGDFDGDGNIDLLVSASQLFSASADGAGDGPDNQRQNAGEAVVLFGPFASSGTVIDLATAAPAGLLTVYGAESSHYLGEDVGAGDLDGDGTHDLILGGIGFDNFDGATYVIRGGSHLRGATLDLLQPPAGVVRFQFTGTRAFLGDTNQSTNLNADRFDDLLIGGPESFGEGIQLFILYGNSRFFEAPLVRDFGPVVASPGSAEFPVTLVQREFGETAYTVAPGRDVDGDGVTDAVFNALDAGGIAYVLGGAQLSGLTDADADGVPDNRDNCDEIVNPDQADTDGDGVGDPCDTCPLAADPTQGDGDGDGLGDACDNCPADPNTDQSDADGDFEGDVCDLDDGLLWFTSVEPALLAWQDERGFSRFNLYRGDLAVLRAGGGYTQDPSGPNAAQFCGLRNAAMDDAFLPPPGTVIHYLVTGIAGPAEISLGTDSSGAERPNDWPCR